MSSQSAFPVTPGFLPTTEQILWCAAFCLMTFTMHYCSHLFIDNRSKVNASSKHLSPTPYLVGMPSAPKVWCQNLKTLFLFVKPSNTFKIRWPLDRICTALHTCRHMVCPFSTLYLFLVTSCLKEIFLEDTLLPKVSTGDAHLTMHLPPSFSQDALLVTQIS